MRRGKTGVPGGKPEYPGKYLAEQSREPTNIIIDNSILAIRMIRVYLVRAITSGMYMNFPYSKFWQNPNIARQIAINKCRLRFNP